MSEIHRQALLAYPARDIFAIICDVDSYPDFLRWCVDSHVQERTEESMLAGLTVAIAGFRQQFTTRNHMAQEVNSAGQKVHRMLIQLQKGPFQQLYGQWGVTQLADQVSRIELHLHFEFKAGLVQAAFSRGFGTVAQQLVADFVQRAHQLLGR